MEPMTSTWSRVRMWMISAHVKDRFFFCMQHVPVNLLWSLSVLRPSSCGHRCWYQWSGRDAGRHVQRLCLCSVPLPRAPPAGARTLVLHPNVQVPAFLLLQELRLHTGSLLVLLLQRILLTGQQHSSVCPDQVYLSDDSSRVIKGPNVYIFLNNPDQAKLVKL